MKDLAGNEIKGIITHDPCYFEIYMYEHAKDINN